MSILCVIPTHRRPELLATAIRSVLAQSTPPDRLVVSDDAADPATLSVVTEAAAGAAIPVEYLPYQDDICTAGGSRNAGFQGAAEDLIAFLDDDDLWEPTFLERTAAKLAANSDIDFVVSWLDHVVDSHRWPGMRMAEGLSASDCYYPNQGMNGSNAIFRRSALAAVDGFDASLVVANDLDLLVRLLEAGFGYAVVKEPLTLQVGHAGEHLTTRSERRALGLIAYGQKHGAKMSRAQRRDIKRVVHAARRGKDRGLPARGWHLAGQLWYTSPVRFLDGARNRLSRNPEMFNRGGAPGQPK